MKKLVGVCIGLMVSAYGLVKTATVGINMDNAMFFIVGIGIVLLLSRDKIEENLRTQLRLFQEQAMSGTQGTVAAIVVANAILDGKVSREDFEFEARVMPTPHGDGVLVGYSASISPVTAAGREFIKEMSKTYYLGHKGGQVLLPGQNPPAPTLGRL